MQVKKKSTWESPQLIQGRVRESEITYITDGYKLCPPETCNLPQYFPGEKMEM